MTIARDTIVDALDVESFVLRVRGLKARNMIAQGNALGRPENKNSSPERAVQESDARVVVPLQGTSFYDSFSRGVAPGYHVIALSARNTGGRNNAQTRVEKPNTARNSVQHARCRWH